MALVGGPQEAGMHLIVWLLEKPWLDWPLAIITLEVRVGVTKQFLSSIV